jgi:ABC-2 type transport system ATP-binding protein
MLGPNGAGKTTTISILTTTLAPTGGRITIAGHDLASQQNSVRRQLGIVFQQPSLDMNLTAEENVRLHAVMYGLYPWRPLLRLMAAEYRCHLGELAEVLGIADVMRRPTRTLSGGMRRKLEIVRALMHRPPVLFLDEPTAGLDPESRANLWAYLREVQRRYRTTIFLTTHYLEEAEGADAICILAHGRVVELGTPESLRTRLGRPELVLDADDRSQLRRELHAMGLTVSETNPMRVDLEGRSAQRIVRDINSQLTVLQITPPPLEQAYIRLLERGR